MTTVFISAISLKWVTPWVLGQVSIPNRVFWVVHAMSGWFGKLDDVKTSQWEITFFLCTTANVNPFLANIPIFYHLKTSEKFRFSGVFRGYKKGALAQNGLKYLTCITFMLWIHALSFYVVSGFLPYLSHFCSASNTNRFNHAQSCLWIRSYQTHKTPIATQTVLLLVQTTAYQLQYQQTDLGYQINTSF